MVDTQPKFKVDFKELAVLAIQRQKRGDVVIILDDSTNEDLDKVVYKTFGEVLSTDWTAENYARIQLAFLGNPSKVIVVKKEETFAEIQEKLDSFDNYKLCYPDATESDKTAIKTYLNTARQRNNYSIAIVANATAPDVDYIVNFKSTEIVANISGSEQTFTAADYTCRIAGALSGLASSRSLTYYELPEIVDATISQTPDADVEGGRLIILHQDGSYKFGRAVNSLTTLTDGVTEAFQKIRIVDIMDMIANDIIATFRKNYVGKYTNNFTNKNRFVGAINSYLSGLAAEGLLEAENQNEVTISYEKNKKYLEDKGVDTSDMTYIEILKANTGSRVLLDGVCSPTDAMEDLDLGMYLYQALQAE